MANTSRSRKLLRLVKVYRTIGAACRQILGAQTEPELLRAVCDVLVDVGGYQLAWVGYKLDDARKTVRPMAQAGWQPGFDLDDASVSWDADDPRSRGVMGSAILSGQPTLILDPLAKPDYAPWRHLAERYGYQVLVGIPLYVDGERVGGLACYARDRSAFGANEVRLLSDLVDDLGRGISALRVRDELARMETELMNVNRVLDEEVHARTAELKTHNAFNEALLGALSKIGDGLVLVKHGKPIYVNDAFCKLTGFSREELLLLDHIADLFVSASQQQLRDECRVRERSWDVGEVQELLVMDASQEPVDVDLVAAPLVDGDAPAVLLEFRDARKRRQQESRVRYFALHDHLTGLANRVLLHDRLEQALAEARRTGKQVAVAFLDLDGFKPINDLYGHQAGDAVLVEIASRLRECVRETDTVARFGGDEFVVVLSKVEQVDTVMAVMNKIAAVIRAPFWSGNKELQVSVSMGVALSDALCQEAELLIERADAAMYQAKSSREEGCRLAD